MKKRTLITAAAILAAMTMLAGCNNGETSGQSNQSSQSSQSTQSTQSTQSGETVSSDGSSSVTSTTGETSSTESTTSDTSSTGSSGSTESTTSDATSEPSAADKPVTVADLSLKDGEYTIGVTLEGGSGKTKVTSPTKLVIKDGAATAEVEFSSSKYDYMKVGETKYDMINTEGNSKFLIPVSGFDYKMPVIANTTAMGNPHEIEYTLFFDSKTIS